MGVLLQFGLGLIPSILAIWLIIAKRKAFGFVNLMAGIIGTTFVLGILATGVYLEFNEDVGFQNIKQGELLVFANILIVQDLIEPAEEVMDQYIQEYGYDDECRLVEARKDVAEANFQKASGLYAYLVENTDLLSGDEREVEMSQSMASFSGEYYTSADILDEIKIEIVENLSEKEEILLECAQILSEVPELEVSEIEEEQIKELRKIRQSIEEYSKDIPMIKDIKYISDSLLKVNIYTGDYDEIVNGLTEDSHYNQYLMAAELYMEGLVTEKDFNNDFGESSGNFLLDYFRKVQLGAQSIVSKIKGEKGDVLKDKEYDDKYDAHPVLYKIKNKLENKALELVNGDSSKIYLQLSKMELYFELEKESSTYIKSAIQNSQECKDDTYADAMYNLMSIINKTENATDANVKNVDEYIEIVIDSSLPVARSSFVLSDEEEVIDDIDSNESVMSINTTFNKKVSEYVVKAQNTIVIGQINTSEFEKITARVQIAHELEVSTKELKEMLYIEDCQVEIEDFTLEKLEFDTTKIVLLCDVSGSMSDSLEDLKAAVVNFIQSKRDTEEVSIVTFSSSVDNVYDFGLSDGELIEAAQNIRLGGGTNMFGAVVDTLDGFKEDNSNKVIVLMSDGVDNNPAIEADIKEQVGNKAIAKGVSVHAIALGAEVDIEYIKSITQYGNGSWVYLRDSDNLGDFYQILHNQMDNQYQITYEAWDTMTLSNRVLDVSLPEINLGDSKEYSLLEDDLGEGFYDSNGLMVNGLNKSYVYKNSSEIELEVKGYGFDKSYSTYLVLRGAVDQKLSLKFVDENTYSFILPGDVVTGEYDVEVVIDGKRVKLTKGLTVVMPGDEKRIQFGDYRFTALTVTENEKDDITLSGMVVLNEWLYFKGDVRLVGDLDGHTIELYDFSGSRVEYIDGNANGLASVYAKTGRALEINSLGTLTLYNDRSVDAPDSLEDFEYDSGYEYKSDSIVLELFSVNGFGQMYAITARLYPYQFVVKGNSFSLGLEDLEKVVKSTGASSIFNFESEIKGVITSKDIGIKADAEFTVNEDGDANDYIQSVNIFNSKFAFSGNLSLKADTLSQEYEVGMMVRPGFLDGSGIGASFEFVEGKMDAFAIDVELSGRMAKYATYYIGLVPITLTEFSLGTSNIAQAIEESKFTKLVGMGSVTLEVAKLEVMVPGLPGGIGELNLCALDEGTVEFTMSPFRISTSANLYIFNKIKLAQTQASLGNFTASNNMIGVTDDVIGMTSRITREIKGEIVEDMLELNLSGSGQVDIHNKFAGLTYTGIGEVNMEWLLFEKELDVKGAVCIGLYNSDDEGLQFVVGYQLGESYKNETKIYTFGK